MRHIEKTMLIASVWIAISCGGNRMKNNEKALRKQILTEEEQHVKDEAVRIKREQQLSQ